MRRGKGILAVFIQRDLRFRSVVAAAAKSRGCGDLRPWSLRASRDFEAKPQNR